MPKSFKSAEEHFWDKVAIGPECWIWAGARQGDGYGTFKIKGTNKTVLAHRYMYELILGAIPLGLVIDHRCRNRFCVNPAHIEPVTLYENVKRGRAWLWGPELTECKHGHAYTEKNTGRNKLGHRYCRECKRVKAEAMREKMRR